MRRLLIIVLLGVITVSCAKKNTKPSIAKPNPPNCNCAQSQAPVQLPPDSQSKGPTETKPVEIKDTKSPTDYSLLKPAKWEEVDGLMEDDLSVAWGAWLQSCSTLKNKPQWQPACSAAKALGKPNNAAIIAYLTTQFDVYSATSAEGENTGLITGYYEPLLQGSRKQSAQYPYPLYAQPKDIVTVELADVYSELKFKRIRGKLVDTKQGGKKLIPYMTRAEIETNPSPLAGSEIVWINDIIDVFFLQIQGSGLVNLDNGQQVHVGYADQNGHAYNSIGRLLIERNELTADQASMQGIKNWARNNLDKLRDLLNSNPSYVFFRELPADLPGPLGALGVPISAERSVAIDPKYIPLGAPIFLSTTQPNSTKPLKRLMMAQDTGGAIKGGVRADFFWGAGDAAGKQAGAMKQQGKIWVLLPKGFVLAK
ncbi:MAG: MltA domain-containing protein [Methylotenera sp.]|nr:MltA domain-containing protein [Methylotenera sp.]